MIGNSKLRLEIFQNFNDDDCKHPPAFRHSEIWQSVYSRAQHKKSLAHPPNHVPNPLPARRHTRVVIGATPLKLAPLTPRPSWAKPMGPWALPPWLQPAPEPAPPVGRQTSAGGGSPSPPPPPPPLHRGPASPPSSSGGGNVCWNF